MPVEPNFLERLLLFRLEKGPAPILDLFGAAGFRAVALALDMGLFETLDRGARTPAELADGLDADEDGVRSLLTFLAAEGYVAESDGRYRNSTSTAKWLTASSETNLAPWFVFWDELVFPFWAENLEAAVREGEPPQTMYEWFDEEPARWRTAQAGFRAAASLVAGEVAANVDVPDGPARMLDVGGGHGRFTIELCRRHPSLSATVFDAPGALDVARADVADAGLEPRVETVGGDYLTDELGSDYDVALLFNVIHGHDAAENVRLFGRVADALASGGRIAVLDQLTGSARTPVGEAGLGFVGLTYLTTLGAEIHSYDDVAAWLREAGFEDVRKASIRRAGPGNTLVQATKRGETVPVE